MFPLKKLEKIDMEIHSAHDCGSRIIQEHLQDSENLFDITKESERNDEIRLIYEQFFCFLLQR